MNIIDKILKDMFHIMGLSAIVGCASIMVLMFIRIATQGYFLAIESNQLILYFEIVFSGYSVAYSIYLFKRFLGAVPK